MLDFGDAMIAAAFYLMIVSTLLCIIYGIINWNKGEAGDTEQQEARDWPDEEHRLDDLP